MMKRTLRLLGHTWLRGWRQLWKHIVEIRRVWGIGLVIVWVILTAPIFIEAWLVHRGVFLGSIPAWAYLTILGAYYLLLAPVLLAFRVPPTPSETADQTLRSRLAGVEADLDRVAARLGINWAWMAEVDALLKAGEQGKAASIYRQEAGITWDEALAAIPTWSKDVVQRKVGLILHAVNALKLVPAEGAALGRLAESKP
jgi:hypothetical protein